MKEKEKGNRGNNRCGTKAAVCVLAVIVVGGAGGFSASAPVVLRPEIDGNWWQVAGNPDLGKYTSAKQQPVDFAVWQAADGTWQLWSCIRNTRCGGHTRLFYRWEGKKLTDTNFQPMGIAMEADPNYGEQPGGLQAPYVIKVGNTYYMFYGDWQRICVAKSEDGKNFTRVLKEKGEPDLFEGPYNNTRDPMVLESNGLYYCYYTGHLSKDSEAKHKAAVFCRTSNDLRRWGEPVTVCAGGTPSTQTAWFGGDCECPFVVEIDGLYYLFRNQRYGRSNLNTQYCSENLLDFGIDDDSRIVGTLPVAAPEIIKCRGQYYIAALMPSLKGIRMARLKWVTAEKKR